MVWPLAENITSAPRAAFAQAITVVFAIMAGLATSPSLAVESIVTKAPKAYLLEPESGTVLYSKAPDETFSPGSLVKVMTATMIFHLIKEGEVRLDQLCTVSEHAWRTGGAPSRKSTMFAAIKSEIAVEDLLKGLLVHNANDAAIVLAECVDGSESAFADRMNAFAATIGMTNSRFTNPTGFEDKPSSTTVRDQAVLAEYVVETHGDLYELFALPEFTWNKIYQRNKNPLLGEIRNLDGLGGGNDPEDGYSGLASVDRNGRRIIAAVAGLNSDKHRLQSLNEIIGGAWEFYAVETIYATGEEIAEARVFGGTESTVPLVASTDIDVLLARGGSLDYRIRVVYEGPFKAPVKKGTPAGELRVIGKEGVVYRAPLVTGADVPAGTMMNRAVDGLQELLFGWIG
ncbi:D-alanyl-D-alanine carboxypeptidase family protein [Roseibium sp. HPY-6]|uniref:D-alanyl-D-alanine carboxypeptidase family protein n=1 Tax=Roseibium sp. HPY-6 TaxID=3229852 RepID=UPI00338E38A2